MSRKRKFEQWQRHEIRQKIAKAQKKMRDPKAYKRLLALRMYGMGKTNKEISEAVGFSVQYITELATKYLEEGMESVVKDKRTSNNRRMSFQEEEQFLDQFAEIAEAGQIITVGVILEKFEEATGKPSNTSTIYRLLKRHGWRKLKPRPKHPNAASAEEQCRQKKLTLSWQRGAGIM